MESQPACRQRCRMHPVPWRDNSKGLRGHAGVKHLRNLPHRAGGTTEVRSIHERQDVCELSSSTHLRGAPEGGPGRQIITITGVAEGGRDCECGLRPSVAARHRGVVRESTRALWRDFTPATRTRTGTSALQPAWRPALHRVSSLLDAIAILPLPRWGVWRWQGFFRRPVGARSRSDPSPCGSCPCPGS